MMETLFELFLKLWNALSITDELHNWVAIMIAFCSMVFTWCGLSQNRRHQIKSVTPKLVFAIRVSDQLSCASISIHNCGIGPAVIKDIKFLFEGKEFDYSFDEIINQIKLNFLSWPISRYIDKNEPNGHF